jgi:OmcA/MtrC family decaheme c-type cytochrome
MRIPSSVTVRVGLAVASLAVSLVVGSVALFSAPKSPFTRHDKAYYLDAAQANFIRPGLVITVKSVKIATDGTVTTDFTVADPKGFPLDRDGVLTPGPVSTSFILAYIPAGQTQYVSYTTRLENDTIPNPVAPNATQATTDSGGVYAKVTDGEYTYTFAKKLPAGYEASSTHTMGVYGSRNITEFDMGTQYASTTFNFVPDGSKVTVTRDVVRTQSCNKCHDQLAFHGGSRRGLELCILCHTPQTTDSGTGNTLDMKVLAHKIHDGSNLPSVQAGGKYNIIGFNNASSDWSTVVFPANGAASSFAGVLKCQVCHDPKSGAAQANAWNTNPNQAACGSCHDDVNFKTGKNHVNLPQADDKLCSQCHIPSTGNEFDASIMGAHTVPIESAQLAGLVVNITKVDNGTAGKKPTVTFTMKDKKGNGLSFATVSRVSLVLAGPTNDYGYTNFGSDVTTKGYVAESPTAANTACSNDGTCTYTFTHAIPADAWGTYSIGIESRTSGVINPGTLKEATVSYGADNKVINFSVDGSKIVARRTVVALANCNNCHARLSLHGENRNQIEQCVLCHNPSMDDSPVRSTTKDPTLAALPPLGINFAYLIHNIHTGENLTAQNRSFIVIGNGGSVNDFSDVRYPAMSATGGVGDTTNCNMCHVGTSNTLPLKPGLNQVSNPQGPMTTMGPVTGACTGCHGTPSAISHAAIQASPEYGESCDVCHGSGAEFDVSKMHAQ